MQLQRHDSSKVVCVVDDDPDIRDVIEDVLEAEGYGVVTAENGAVALETLRHGKRPCLILLDLMMPVMDGWQFEEHRARDAALSGIPVIILSGAGRARVEAASKNVEGALTKPIALNTLLETVARYCRC
jgi:CheY-like chemotaxis protein